MLYEDPSEEDSGWALEQEPPRCRVDTWAQQQ